ncbi:hypothetical protein JL720_1012 [Aureococcus anophagefferens]|nr:hypothetical protein JL720_1012 [Aureococcus anophagefferens]
MDDAQLPVPRRRGDRIVGGGAPNQAAGAPARARQAAAGGGPVRALAPFEDASASLRGGGSAVDAKAAAEMRGAVIRTVALPASAARARAPPKTSSAAAHGDRGDALRRRRRRDAGPPVGHGILRRVRAPAPPGPRRATRGPAGIIGAVAMRGVMIAVGVELVNRFRSVTLVFAGILLASSYKLLVEDDHGDGGEMGERTRSSAVWKSNLQLDFNVVRLGRKLCGGVDYFDGDKFFTLVDGAKVATPLLLCVVCIELSDFVFAVDSIPAVLAISKDPFIVYSSNIFAIAALRSLYQVLAAAIAELPYLRPAVALILGFVGVKMLAEYFHVHIPTATGEGGQATRVQDSQRRARTEADRTGNIPKTTRLTYKTEGLKVFEADGPFCCRKARSVCFWAKKTAAETGEMHVVFQLGVHEDLKSFEVYFRDDRDDTYFGAHFGTSQLKFEVSDLELAVPVKFNDEWHHYCAILSDPDVGELALSVDGAKVKTFRDLPQFNTRPSAISVGRVLEPGDCGGGGGDQGFSRRLASEDDCVHSHFHGYIDELRLYDSALSEQDVQRDYNEGAAMPPCEASICKSVYVLFKVGDIVCHYSGTCELATDQATGGDCAGERCAWALTSMPSCEDVADACHDGYGPFEAGETMCWNYGECYSVDHPRQGQEELCDDMYNIAQYCAWTNASPTAPAVSPAKPGEPTTAPSVTPPAPSVTPTPAPSVTPTPAPSVSTPAPSVTPTPVPSVSTPAPSVTPTPVPSVTPTPAPSVSTPAPSVKPGEPTPAPSVPPTPAPSVPPTPAPSVKPTPAPSVTPTPAPSVKPGEPTLAPVTPAPTFKPSDAPTPGPTPGPTVLPGNPTAAPVTPWPSAKPPDAAAPRRRRRGRRRGPGVEGARFDASGGVVVVTLNGPAAVAVDGARWPCDDASSSPARRRACAWESATRLAATLGPGATVRAGDGVALRAGAVQGAGAASCGPSNGRSPRRSPPRRRRARAVLTPAASTVVACEGLTLDVSASTGHGGRAWASVAWTAVVGETVTVTVALENFLGAAAPPKALAFAVAARAVVRRRRRAATTSVLAADGLHARSEAAASGCGDAAGGAGAVTSAWRVVAYVDEAAGAAVPVGVSRARDFVLEPTRCGRVAPRPRRDGDARDRDERGRGDAEEPSGAADGVDGATVSYVWTLAPYAAPSSVVAASLDGGSADATLVVGDPLRAAARRDVVFTLTATIDGGPHAGNAAAASIAVVANRPPHGGRLAVTPATGEARRRGAEAAAGPTRTCPSSTRSRRPAASSPRASRTAARATCCCPGPRRRPRDDRRRRRGAATGDDGAVAEAGATVAALRASSDADLDATVASGEVEEAYAALVAYSGAVEAGAPPGGAAAAAATRRGRVRRGELRASSLAAIASTAALDEAASAGVLESARALAADAAARGVDDEARGRRRPLAAVAAAPPPRSGDGRRLQASSSLDDVAAALSSVCEALLNNAAADEAAAGRGERRVIGVRCSKLSPATAPGALVNASAGALALPASTDLGDGEWLESTTIIVDVRSRTLSFGFATDSPDGRRRLRRGGFSSGGGGATLSFDDDVDGPAGLSETLYAVNVTCAGEDIVVACDGGGDDVTVPCGPDNEGTVYEATCVRQIEPGCAEYDVAAGAWVAVCAATSSAGATVCECSPEQVALWAAYDGSTAVASTTNAVFTSYYAELFAEGLTDAVWTRTTLLLYTLAALVGATVLLGVWGWDKDRRCRADATRKALDAFVDSKAKFRGSRGVSEKVSLSSIPLEVHDGLLEASMPNFMAKVHTPGSLVWDKIKQYHCVLSVVFYYDPRFSRLTRAFLALFDVVVILFAEAVTYELVFPAGVCESLEDLGDAASSRGPAVARPGSGAYDNLVRITMVALSIAVCLPALKLAAFATRRYLARDHVWAWRPDAGGRDDDEVLFDDAGRDPDDGEARARASAHETFDFRAALDNADVSRFERQVLRALPGTMRAVVRQRVELNDALLDLKTGRHPGMSVTERRALASNLGFLKHRLELLWGISSTGSAGWEYVFASTAYRVLSHAIKEAIAFDRDLQQVEDPATKCLLIYHFCRYENLNDDERRVLRQALNTRGTWAEEGDDFREPPVSGYVKVALLVLMVLVLAATAYFLLVFGLGRDEAVQREWWADTMLTLGLILVIFEPARIAVCHCSVPMLIGNKMEHYRDPVRLRLPYRNAAPSTASELISAQHLAAFEDVGLPVPTVLRVAEKAAARDDGSDDDDDFVDPLARSNRRRRAAEAPEPTRLRRCGAWAATAGHRVVRANAGDLGNPSTVDPHHAAYNRAYRALSPRWAPACARSSLASSGGRPRRTGRRSRRGRPSLMHDDVQEMVIEEAFMGLVLGASYGVDQVADSLGEVELVYGPDTRASKKRYGDRACALLLANCRIFDDRSERKLDVAFDCNDDEARDEWADRFDYLLGTAARGKHATYAAQAKAVQLVARTVVVDPRRFRRDASSLEAKRANATAILARDGLLRHLAKTVEHVVKRPHLSMADAVDLLLAGNCVRMLLALPGVLRAVLRKKVERKSLEAFLYLSATSRVPLFTSAALEIMAALYLSRGAARDAVDGVLLRVDRGATWGGPGLGFADLPEKPDAPGFDDVPRYGSLLHLLDGAELDDLERFLDVWESRCLDDADDVYALPAGNGERVELLAERAKRRALLVGTEKAEALVASVGDDFAGLVRLLPEGDARAVVSDDDSSDDDEAAKAPVARAVTAACLAKYTPNLASMRAIEVVGAARAEAAVSGDVDGVPPADPALEKFHKMLKMHVPQGAVEAKMRAEGLDPDALKYEKYRSMLRMHVPRGAVEAKMRADGLDPAGLFGAPKAAKAAPKADPATASMKRRFETPLAARAARQAEEPLEAAAAKQAAAGTKKRSVVAEVLGPRRGLELNILHGSLKVEPRRSAALKHLDAAALADKADVLHGLFESDETVAAMTAAVRPFLVEARTGRLGESSVCGGAAAPRAPAKVHCLRLASRLDGRVDALDAALDTLRDAADEVKRARGAALRVSSLRKLKNAKTAPMADLGDAAPGTCSAAGTPTSARRRGELATARRGAGDALSDLRADVAALEADAAAAAREADAPRRRREDGARPRPRRRRAVDALQDKLAATSSACALLLRGFGEDPAKVPAEALRRRRRLDFKRGRRRPGAAGGRRPRGAAPRAAKRGSEQTFLAGIRHSLKRAGAIRTLAAADSDDEFDAATAANRRRSMLRRAISGGGDSDDGGPALELELAAPLEVARGLLEVGDVAPGLAERAAVRRGLAPEGGLGGVRAALGGLARARLDDGRASTSRARARARASAS